MLRDEFVTRLQRRLGNNQDETLRDDIIAEMAFVQQHILETDVVLPWFLLTEEASGETIAGDERVPLPADYLAPWEEGFIYRYDATQSDPYIELTRDDWGVIKQELNYSGIPTHYDLLDDYILMRPVSDTIYPLRMRYYARSESLNGVYGDANNLENKWLEHAGEWFMGEVGQIIAEQYLQMNAAAVKKFTEQAARGRARIIGKNIMMQELMKERVIGG